MISLEGDQLLLISNLRAFPQIFISINLIYKVEQKVF